MKGLFRVLTAGLAGDWVLLPWANVSVTSLGKPLPTLRIRVGMLLCVDWKQHTYKSNSLTPQAGHISELEQILSGCLPLPLLYHHLINRFSSCYFFIDNAHLNLWGIFFFYFFEELVFLGGGRAKWIATLAFSFHAITLLTSAFK